MITIHKKVAVRDTVSTYNIEYKNLRLKDIIDDVCPNVCQSAMAVYINGHRVPHHLFNVVSPKDKSNVLVVIIGQGGGGGILPTVLAIGAMVVAPTITPFLATTLGVSATVAGVVYGLGVSYAVGTFFAPEIPKLGSLGSAGTKPKRTDRITGDSNSPAFGQIKPVVFGRTKVQPLHFAEPYTESVGNDTYYRLLMVVTRGIAHISDIEINGTPISKWNDVQTEILNGYADDTVPTLYTNTIGQRKHNVTITDTRWSRFTTTECEEFELVVGFQQGLVKIVGNQYNNYDVEIKYRFRKKVASGQTPNSWTNKTVRFSSNQLSYITRFIKESNLSEGQYEIEVQRSSAESTATDVRDNAKVVMLKSIQYKSPIKESQIGKYSFIAMRIKASGQLTGSIGSITCIVDSLMPKFATDGTIAYPTDNKAQHANNLRLFKSDNPACAFLHVLNLADNPIPQSQINIPILKSWHDYCVGKHSCNGLVDSETTINKLLNRIANTGYAMYGRIDNKESIIRGDLIPSESGLVTDANSRDFRTSRKYEKPHDAVKVIWISPERGYKREETLVYATGKNAKNAEKIDELTLPYTSKHKEAYSLGRLALAMEQLQPDTHTWVMDYQAIGFKQGDRIILEHPVIKTSFHTAIIIERKMNQRQIPQMVEIVMSEPFTPKSGKSYKISYMHENNYVTLSATFNESAVTLSAPTDKIPEIGQPVSVVETGKKQYDVVVREIERLKDYDCKITAVNYDPNIYNTGTIPAYAPVLSVAQKQPVLMPATPDITRIVSDETALLIMSDGSLVSRILVYFGSSGEIPDAVEVGYRTDSAQDYRTATAIYNNGFVEIPNVVDSVTYDIRIRAIKNNIAGEWGDVETHTVIGKTTPPPAPDNINHYDGIIYWDLPNRPKDLAGFDLRYNYLSSLNPAHPLRWEDAVPLNTGGVITSSPYDITNMFDRNVAVLVKSVDTTGNLSNDFVSVNVPFDQHGIINKVLFKKYEPDWADPITTAELVNFEIANGELRQNNQSGGFYETATWTARIIIPERFDNRIAMVDFEKTGDVSLYQGIDTPFYDGGGSGDFYDGGGSNPFFTPIDFSSVQPLRFIAKKGTHLIRIVAKKQQVKAVVKSLKFYIDYPTITERFTNLSISSGGTKLSPTKPFIKYLGLENERVSGKIPVKLTYDIPTDGTAPTVYAWDIQNGRYIDATATFDLLGY